MDLRIFFKKETAGLIEIPRQEGAGKTCQRDALDIAEAISARWEKASGGVGDGPMCGGAVTHKPVPTGSEHHARLVLFTLLLPPLASPRFTSTGKQTSGVIPLLFARKPTAQTLTLA